MPAGLIGNHLGSRHSHDHWRRTIRIGFQAIAPRQIRRTNLADALDYGDLCLRILVNTFFLVNSIPFLTSICPPQVRNYVFSTQVALWPLAGFAGA